MGVIRLLDSGRLSVPQLFALARGADITELTNVWKG